MGTMKAAVKIVASAAGACAVLALGAGTASAVELYSGDRYQAISFDRNETRVLRDVGAGNILDAVVPRDQQLIYLGEGSIYDTHPTLVFASTHQLLKEAVSRGGTMAFTVNDPAYWGNIVDLYQNW
ncbi:hypothetical protein [Rhodococcus sp. SGAir0479]|uniref:hypothetical protein n=1 Tax=Rhodococcus sp. SGAir0479 TaxID=2567884 RepID=UPI0010CD68B7|nr:hypothetical protein [Rhodococcus sp. SGAir0479]QCQ93247.1 hypothetical protein E7742_19840 [Rhodococcus sp. SGAir0479]